MARTMTLEERLQRSRQVGAEATKPTTNQLAASTGVAPPSSAYGASLIPGVTADQAKMMGTPAQKGAQIAAAQGETELEQATKLRAPTTASVLDVAKQRQAAGLAQALGTAGDKATELVERTFQNIIGQGVQAAGGAAEKPVTGVALQVDTAARQLTGKKPEEIDAIAALINNIATMPAGADRNAETKKLNEALGLTGENALTSEQVPALISKLPETVAAAAAGQVKATIGEKLTLADLGQLGTTPGELASLLKVDEATIAEMTLPELQNRLAALGQTEFGETQAVTAGTVSGLLAPSQRAALRDVLVSLEERGVAGAEFQVAQIGKDIVDGTSITVGGKEYTIQELLSTEEMTDIVTDVLADPTSTFSKKLKESNPSLYNWIIASQDGLKKLLAEAGTGVGAFRTLQEKNIALLKPLAGFKDYFKSLGFDLDALRDTELTKETLPPVPKAILSLPPEKQGKALTVLRQLPASEVKDLTAEEVASLQLENDNGPAAKWLLAQKLATDMGPLNTAQEVVNAFLATDMSLADIDAQLKSDRTAAALGYPTTNLMELDADKNGRIDNADIAALKNKMVLPSFTDAVKGAALPQFDSFRPTMTTLTQEQGDTLNAVRQWNSDGSISPEEVESANWSDDKIRQIISQLPPSSISIRVPLEVVLAKRQAARESADVQAADQARRDEEARLAKEEEDRKLAEGRAAEGRRDTRASPGGLFGGKLSPDNMRKGVSKYLGGK